MYEDTLTLFRIRRQTTSFDVGHKIHHLGLETALLTLVAVVVVLLLLPLHVVLVSGTIESGGEEGL